MIEYSIKDLERLSGIKAHTLRIWESRYNILKPERTDTNIRRYSDLDLKRILNISCLNHRGYKISKIAEFSDDLLSMEVEKLINNYENEEHQVDGLVLSMIDFDEDRFENLITKCIENFGFEKTVEKVIFPFLIKTGILWQIGVVSPTQEHFISQLIKQKLFVAIDSLKVKPSTTAKKFIFFLPPNELHEMSLLYYSYLCKLYGNASIYLGQSVPTEDLIKVCLQKKPDYIVCVLSIPMRPQQKLKYIENLSKELPSTKILLSGALVLKEKTTLFNNIFLFEDPAEFKKHL